MKYQKKIIENVLDSIGVQLNGNSPEDITVNDELAYSEGLMKGTLGIGESYMKGWWDCEALDVLTAKASKASVRLVFRLNPISLFIVLKKYLFNLSRKDKAFEIGEVHYDTGNDLFEKMLGPAMTYSCGYWEEADNLYEAQIAKLDLVCKKLDLKPGQKLLDIGCGWGSLARHASENYGVEVVGVTVSEEQAEYARQLNKDLPVEIRLQDYRDIDEEFDSVASIGMFEHVGHKNYAEYMSVAEKVLKPNGRFLLHTIGKDELFASMDPWISKYIFPNSEIPIRRHTAKAIQKTGFNVWDWHEFGKYYDLTLIAWYKNFEQAWPDLKDKYKDKVNGMFYRMWRFYLLTCAGIFRSGKLDLWQILLSKEDRSDDYQKIR